MGESAPPSIITLPKNLEPESQDYSPIRGNLDTGGTHKQREGTPDDRRMALVKGNGTVLPFERGRSGKDRFLNRRFLAKACESA